MSEAAVSDYNGQPLREGARVEAWYDGVRYTATVKKIRPQHPASGYRDVILVRESDHAEVRSFSDAVVVIGETET